MSILTLFCSSYNWTTSGRALELEAFLRRFRELDGLRARTVPLLLSLLLPPVGFSLLRCVSSSLGSGQLNLAWVWLTRSSPLPSCRIPLWPKKKPFLMLFLENKRGRTSRMEPESARVPLGCCGLGGERWGDSSCDASGAGCSTPTPRPSPYQLTVGLSLPQLYWGFQVFHYGSTHQFIHRVCRAMCV